MVFVKQNPKGHDLLLLPKPAATIIIMTIKAFFLGVVGLDLVLMMISHIKSLLL